MLRRFISTSTISRSYSKSYGIQTYCCKTKKKVPLVLKNPAYTSWYTCGPTVYDSSHLGHASTYVRIDILQRILRDYFKINLITAMNITNIDDKIIKSSLEIKMNWKELANKYEAEFWDDLDSLNVIQPNFKVRVSEKIENIVKFIEKLLQDNIAYATSDGSVYFRTKSFQSYGKLQNVVLESMEHDSKDSTLDFALWKGAKPNEPSWDTKWGKGRPGWHIECSAMASELFGSYLDFHAGGVDLKFPHHENEEAQSCCYHKVDDWVGNWIHTGHLHMEGQKDKMSKSLKNTILIRDFLKTHSADQFRMACLLSHYRSSIEFGEELLITSDAILKKLNGFMSDSKAYIGGLKGHVDFDESSLISKLINCQENVDKSIKDDFNTSKAIGNVIELISSVSKNINNSEKSTAFYGSSNKTSIQAVMNYVEDIFGIFGISVRAQKNITTQDSKNEAAIDSIIKIRNEIRLKAKHSKNKELFQVCDNIRDSLKLNKIEIKDHGNLSSWNYFK